jgi:hypothetical protein
MPRWKVRLTKSIIQPGNVQVTGIDAFSSLLSSSVFGRKLLDEGIKRVFEYFHLFSGQPLLTTELCGSHIVHRFW